MRSVRKSFLVVLLTLLAPALVACGSSGDDKKADDKPTVSSSETPGDDETDEPDASDLVELSADGYTVRLPGEATPSEQTAQSQAGPIKFTLYTAQDGDGGTFVVAMSSYPKNAVLDLDGAIEGTAKAINGEVQESKTVRILGRPARIARITASPSGQDVTVFARAVLVDRKLFQLQYVALEKDLATAPAIVDEVMATVKFG